MPEDKLITELRELFTKHGLYIVSDDPYCGVDWEKIEGSSAHDHQSFSDAIKQLEERLPK